MATEVLTPLGYVWKILQQHHDHMPSDECRKCFPLDDDVRERGRFVGPEVIEAGTPAMRRAKPRKGGRN
jgi:hypothetical protein